ncbi:Protein DNJ-15 [Aphelenchoides avenae]|nr:Protein DNJ-15 [Aphelenchus avenae]
MKISHNLRKLQAFKKLLVNARIPLGQKPFATEPGLQCWKCKHQRAQNYSIACAACNALQPLPPGVDYFSYLGIDRKYKIDEATLKNAFRQLQTIVHPDKHGGSSTEEQDISHQHSSYLNQAYRTLREPRTRAKYLLEISNMKVDEKPDDDLALEMMELNEEIEETQDQAQLKRKLSVLESEAQRLMDDIEKHFELNRLEEVRNCLNRLRFYGRSKDLIREKLNK